ncbi:amidohydrolase [Paenibacillus glacialis]|uniref:Amidohydrolase n=1 Tax=Paenibacillus glacialis TaxID=494026 RepID=A0A168KRU8_9BACL|nr:amidohydrolase [Paenibacillus glacialis]OAB42382.1 amidohydrolase [Paenibacillus glacialis]
MGKIWCNGTIYTMEHKEHIVQAVYTEHGTIIATGTKEELESRFQDYIDEVIDLQGNTMFPGFVDSHMHLIGLGETFLKLDLSSMNSREEVLQAVADRVDLMPEGSWIIAEGWNENRWMDTSHITRELLDEVAPHHPVMLRRICRHVLVVNTRAMEAAQIVGMQTTNTDGVTTTDSMTHDGIFKENAQDIILHAVPAASETYLQEALKLAIQHAWSQGLVGAHTEDLSYYGSYTRTISAFNHVIHEEPMKFRTHLLVHHMVVDEWRNAELAMNIDSPFLECGAMKIFVDGALGGRTALLSGTYADDPNSHGIAIHTDEELSELVQKARSYGLPIAVHAIGDLAAEKVLEVIERYSACEGTRDRLIHGQLLSQESLERMKNLPIVIDIQPSFVSSDYPWVMERISVDTDLHMYAWQTMFVAGLHCAGGSDAPIEQVSPLLGMYTAVTRMNSVDLTQTVYQPDERLSVFDAISLYTTGSAYASGHEHDRGMIREGFVADFTILKIDPFLNTPNTWLKEGIAMTVIDECIVYQRD